jgi:DNA invertase Pin-like site-specific DNA recombinase
MVNNMKDRIIELRKEGLTANEIAIKLKCAKSTVSYHINKHNLGGNVSKLNLDVDNDILNEIIELRNQNKTFDEIHRLVNITKDKLKIVCRNLNFSDLKNKKDNIDDLTKTINKYYLDVKSLRKCAEHFNLPRHSIRKIINDNIIHERPKLISKSESVISWRKRTKISLVEYKGGKCELCGYNKSVNALQFHHLSPNEKDFTISGKSYSFERLKTEVDKCMLVCANCHHEIHEKI